MIYKGENWFGDVISEFILELCDTAAEGGMKDYSGLSWYDMVQDTQTINEYYTESGESYNLEIESKNTYITFNDGATKTVYSLTDRDLVNMMYELAFNE